MQGIYNYIPETPNVSKVYNVTAILQLQYMAHVMIFSMINALYCTLVLPEVCAQCPIWLFCVVP
jgi:hypothetical protein